MPHAIGRQLNASKRGPKKRRMRSGVCVVASEAIRGTRAPCPSRDGAFRRPVALRHDNPPKHGPLSVRCVSGLDSAKRPRKRNEPFAKRNEWFRIVGRKALKSLWVPNQHFAGLFVFNGLTVFSFRAVFKWSSLSPKSGANWIGERLSRPEAEFAGQKYIALISD
jgi:hypothetical protein